MRRSYIILFLMLLNLVVIFYIDYRIHIADMDFYIGKDDGLTLRFETTIILSIIYFFIISKYKIVFLLYGFIVGVISFIFCYLIIGKFTKLNEIFYQIIATILFMIVFHLLVKDKITTDNKIST